MKAITMEDWDARVDRALSSREVPAELRIVLSSDALAQAKALCTTDEHLGQSLRVYIEGKGCDGFFYGVAFDKPTDKDLAWEQDSLPVIVDVDAFRFICGSVVAWVNDERGRGFLVENPHHRRFRGKFYKKGLWKERLESGKPQAQN